MDPEEVRPAGTLCAAVIFSALAIAQPSTIPDGDWPNYGRDPGGTKYSPLREITRENVAGLKQAWIYRTGDLLDMKGSDHAQPAHEATPLFVDETLYVSTPFGRVIALDSESARFAGVSILTSIATPTTATMRIAAYRHGWTPRCRLARRAAGASSLEPSTRD
jgi:hypothetical protein